MSQEPQVLSAPGQSRSRLPNAPEDEGFAQAESDVELVSLWLDGKSEHTRSAYERDLTEFIDRVDKPIRAVTLGDVQAFRAYLEERRIERGDEIRPLAASTVSRKLAAVKSLFSFAHEVGYIRFNVGRPVKTPRVRQRLSEKIPLEEEIHALFAAARTVRNRVICRLFYGSALRRAELAALQWRDLQARPDFVEVRGQVSVFGKGEKERTVLLSASTWRAIGELRRQEEAAGRGRSGDPVCWSRKGGALSGTQIYRIVKKIAKRAGLEERGFSPHSFRHAHLSHALDRGATVEEARLTGGHASVETTGKYLHARPDRSTSDYLPG